MPELPFKRVSVVGLGYIGLPTAAMFASRKIEVVGVDVNQHAVDTINRGEVHIVEPDLDMVVRAAVSEGFLRATTVPEPAEAPIHVGGFFKPTQRMSHCDDRFQPHKGLGRF